MVNSQFCFDLGRLDDGIPKNHVSRFIVRFVDQYFPILGVEENEGGVGRPNLPVREMFKLMLYAYCDNVTSSRVIADHAKYHRIYMYVYNNIQPSERSIRRFMQNYGYLFNVFLGFTLIFAKELGLTDFEHIAIDGTIKKSNNSSFNVFNQKEVNFLIGYYSGITVPRKKIKKSSLPVRKFIERKDLSDDNKLDLLFCLDTELSMSGQNTIPVNDVEARWMHNKKGLSEVGYNVQSAVDTQSKHICAIKVSQNPTDHYELPEIVEQSIENTKTKPAIISADTAYHNTLSFKYLEENKIKGAIVDRQQTRRNTGRKSKNPFHKDYFKYNFEKDVFICPNNNELSFQTQVTHSYEDKEKPDKIERRYWNYEACKNCKDKNKCHKGVHRQITEFATPFSLEMKNKMETEEYKKIYKKRSSTVESPFGTLKVHYHINDMKINGIKQTENFLALFSTVYNIKRLYNIMEDIYENSNHLDLFKEKIEILLNIKCKFIPKK